ncbi:hypothetical protein OEV98_13335 [Caldibacillus lycopersici]|uniref:Uncharacterized protein n=1 Tax=Perspicuibacillus lycopersici TaxID=1325689 RepID=A0AAE3IU41_9BACI|nr:hypothetical protein [Perspicuibacillus lycopersici]MCU9614521.1 hypothetical protein [Perspicuibacillus lycopersici]
MRPSKLILYAMMILPWLTVPFLGKKTIKRFLPASLFMSSVVWVEGHIARNKRWWFFYEKIVPKAIGEFPLIVGVFLIGTLWILRFTYGKFIRFIILNLIVDSFFTFVVVEWFQKLKVATLVRINKIQLSLLFLLKSMLLYGFQFIIEKTKFIKE